MRLPPSRIDRDPADELPWVLVRELADRIATAHTGMQLLEAEGLVPPERRSEVFSLVRRALDHVLGTMDELVSIRRTPERRSEEVRPLAEIVRQVCCAMGPFARASGVRLQVFDASPVPLHVDAWTARFVLWHLIMYGIRRADHGTGDPAVTIETRLKGPCVLIEVTDNGVTLEAEVRAEIDRPGARARADTSAHGPSPPGLDDVVARVGGWAGMESGGGGGTTIRVGLPVWPTPTIRP